MALLSFVGFQSGGETEMGLAMSGMFCGAGLVLIVVVVGLKLFMKTAITGRAPDYLAEVVAHLGGEIKRPSIWVPVPTVLLDPIKGVAHPGVVAQCGGGAVEEDADIICIVEGVAGEIQGLAHLWRSTTG